jgi:hypothetical protein
VLPPHPPSTERILARLVLNLPEWAIANLHADLLASLHPEVFRAKGDGPILWRSSEKQGFAAAPSFPWIY